MTAVDAYNTCTEIATLETPKAVGKGTRKVSRGCVRNLSIAVLLSTVKLCPAFTNSSIFSLTAFRPFQPDP